MLSKIAPGGGAAVAPSRTPRTPCDPPDPFRPTPAGRNGVGEGRGRQPPRGKVLLNSFRQPYKTLPLAPGGSSLGPGELDFKARGGSIIGIRFYIIGNSPCKFIWFVAVRVTKPFQTLDGLDHRCHQAI